MKVRRSLLRDLVTVETHTGGGAYGPVFAAAVTVKVNADNTRRLVRNAAGVEVISEATLTVHPYPRDEATGLALDAMTLFAPESRITLSGRVSVAISTVANTVRGNIAWVRVMVA